MTIFIWGGILGHLDLDSLTIFIWGYSGTPQIWTGLSDNFHLGGILGHLGFGLYDNFHFGGYSGTPWIWTL